MRVIIIVGKVYGLRVETCRNEDCGSCRMRVSIIVGKVYGLRVETCNNRNEAIHLNKHIIFVQRHTCT